MNAKDGNGRTPLHMSHAWVIRLLIRYGADVNATDNNNWTPLHRYCYSAPLCVSVLLQSSQHVCINMFTRAPHYYTPLQLLTLSTGHHELPDATAAHDLPMTNASQAAHITALIRSFSERRLTLEALAGDAVRVMCTSSGDGAPLPPDLVALCMAYTAYV